VGVEELDVGAELPELPVLPVLPELPVLPVLREAPSDAELPVLVPLPAFDPEVFAPLCRLLAPGWSWATTIPMATVAPVARRAAARVRIRTRAWPRSRLSGAFG
jgi:hypothetical protein